MKKLNADPKSFTQLIFFSYWMFSLFPKMKQTEEAESMTSTCPASCSTWTTVHIIPVTVCFLFLITLHVYTFTSWDLTLPASVFDLNRLCGGRNTKREQNPLCQSLCQSKLLRKRQAWLLGLEINWKIFKKSRKSDWWILLQLSWWMGTIASVSSPNEQYSRERSCFSTTGIL